MLILVENIYPCLRVCILFITSIGGVFLAVLDFNILGRIPGDFNSFIGFRTSAHIMIVVFWAMNNFLAHFIIWGKIIDHFIPWYNLFCGQCLNLIRLLFGWPIISLDRDRGQFVSNRIFKGASFLKIGKTIFQFPGHHRMQRSYISSPQFDYIFLRRPRNSEEMDGTLKIDQVKFSQLSAMLYSELYIKHQKFLCTQINPTYF